MTVLVVMDTRDGCRDGYAYASTDTHTCVLPGRASENQLGPEGGAAVGRSLSALTALTELKLQ